MKRITVAISGASGAPYAVRLLEALINAECAIHLTISRPAALVLNHEMNLRVDLENFSPEMLIGEPTDRIHYHHYDDISAPIASGSFPTDAMVIVPCSMSTLAGVAAGLGNNLILRAADVALKEGRPLVLVPRETPLSTIALENMARLSRAGACILPAMPAFYYGPKEVRDMVDFVVGKILNQLGVRHGLFRGWKGDK